MLENIRISLRGIWSHKLRSFLTMLGIIIGIAAIVAIVSTIQGANEQIKNNLIGSGNNNVEVKLTNDGTAMDFSYAEAPAGVPAFDQTVKDQVNKIDGVVSSSFFHERSYNEGMYYQNTSMSGCQLLGIDEDYLNCAGLTVSHGRGISRSEFTSNAAVAVVDDVAAQAYFGGADPVGENVQINGVTYVVVGVVRQASAFQPRITSVSDYKTYVGSTSGRVMITNQMWALPFVYDEPLSVLVQAKSPDAMTSVGRSCASVLNSYLQMPSGSTIKYESTDLASEATRLQQLADSTNAMLIGIASISLLVGGVGVMNIMLVSVTERTREIGLKKALGAPKSSILSQFLTEAVMLSFIGGVLGALLGVAMSHVIGAVTSMPVMISVPAMIVSVVFSMCVGVVFGLVPSVKASNLNPIDALRYE